MTEQELNQLRRDLDEVVVRMRQVEALESPFLRSVYERFMRLINRVEILESQGNPILIKNLVDDVREIKEDQKAIRATVRSALITAALGVASSLIVGTILYVLLHGGTPG